MLTYHVDTEFTEISIELTWESETSGDTRHSDGDQMVQITICWSGEFEGSELICLFLALIGPVEVGLNS